MFFKLTVVKINALVQEAARCDSSKKLHEKIKK